ncbi:GTP-binding protein 10 [Xyrauchen texanus]|uniref:GTP-binding protein 10 n=1 Tax=Xyrauchen texanus TaxID=154827 RepID=UPI002241C0F1|nr:GTP-binding protein 10 [Xyrauchen texanus]XP_052000464.1 GTP-binding protein 10 [Xyrauchen texanus]
MVWTSRVCFRKYGNFVDNVRLYVKGGSGGMGLPRLGGHGGNGGDVWVVAKKGVTLKQIKDSHPNKRFTACVGSNSSIHALKGAKGEDARVFAPTGICVTTDDGRFLGELNCEEDKLQVARGGQGGTLHSGFLPSKGQTRQIRLDLKLIADLGLVGFPNAGKSSLLTALSHAKPRVASYPFTTLRPEIGRIMYDDHKQVSLADLPGLIEGAHENKGMGHKFLKHVERTKQLMFVVDICGFQLASNAPFRSAFETVLLLTKELELYKEELLAKPAILVINKMDLPEAQGKLRELHNQLENQEDSSRCLPEDMTPRGLMHFTNIIPVSATTGLGLPVLKTLIRQSLEEQDTIETESQRSERLLKLRREIPTPVMPSWGHPV